MNTNVSPLNRKVLRPISTLKQQVSDTLRGCITDLTFKPGTRLIERKLCEMLGVSRTLIRESLSQLIAEGLVQHIPHKGPIVTVVDAKEAKSLYEVRATLEALAARRFTIHATDEQRAELKLALHNLINPGDEDPVLHFLKSKQRFYEVMLRGSDSPVLSEMLRLIQARVTLLRASTLSQPGRLDESYNEIEAIMLAAIRGDADGAAEAAQFHVLQAEQIATRLLEGNEPSKIGS